MKKVGTFGTKIEIPLYQGLQTTIQKKLWYIWLVDFGTDDKGDNKGAFYE